MGYLRRTLNYSKIIVLLDLTHMMSMANPIAIGVETLRIDRLALWRRSSLNLSIRIFE